MRGSFVFDNVAIYLIDPRTKGLEVAYARAMDAAKMRKLRLLGESLANEVMTTGKKVIKEPVLGSEDPLIGIGASYWFSLVCWR